MATFILGISAVLQFIAAMCSVRLIKVTGRWRAWTLIATAMTLMGVRRSITLYRTITSDTVHSADMTAELVALTISILMLVGVMLIAPIFRRIQTTNQTLQETIESHAQLQVAVDSAQTAMMMVGRDFKITYLNQQSKDLLQKHEVKFQMSWPEFDAKNMIGVCIDMFHKKPTHQRNLLSDPNNLPYTADIKINDLMFSLTVTAQKDLSGNYIGNTLEWEDVTEHRQMENRLKHMASHDPLTGLYNRNIMEQRLNDEISRASRYKHKMSAFMLDLDHFKTINDTYGHHTGDKVLQYVAKILENSIRNTDYAARYGGEEFIVILPETPLPKAEELAERLRNKIEEHSFPIKNDKELCLTASIGIATYPDHAQTSQKLLEAADSAMYDAKKAGRNNVKVTDAAPDLST